MRVLMKANCKLPKGDGKCFSEGWELMLPKGDAKHMNEGWDGRDGWDGNE